MTEYGVKASQVNFNASGKIINVSSYLNVRSSPSTNSSILGTLKNNDSITIVMKTEETLPWYGFYYGDNLGWVRSDFVEILFYGVPATVVELNRKSLMLKVYEEYQLTAKVSPEHASQAIKWAISNNSDGDSDNNGDFKNGIPSYNYVRFLKGYEGYAKYLYKNSGGRATIGYGTTKEGEATEFNKLVNNQPVSEIMASKTVLNVLVKNYSARWKKQILKYAKTQNQFDALLDLAYNCTGDAMNENNSLWVALRTGDESYIRSAWEKYFIKDNAQNVLNGLKLRRKAECNMWFNNIYEKRPIPIIGKNGGVTGTMQGDGYMGEAEQRSSAIATIDQNGVVTALKTGVVTITATANSGVTDTCQLVIVNEYPANETAYIAKGRVVNTTTSLTVRQEASVEFPKIGELKNGDVVNITAKTIENLPWYRIEYNNSYGYVRSDFIQIISEAVDVESISINESFYEVKKGDTIRLNATILPSNASNKSIKWTTSESDIIKLNDNGEIYGYKAGYATVSAISSNGKTVCCCIHVVDNPIKGTNILQNGAPKDNKNFWWADQANGDHVKLEIGGHGENFEGRYWNSGLWFTGTHGKNEETNESWFIIGQNSFMDYKFNTNEDYCLYFYIYSEEGNHNFSVAIADSNSSNIVCPYKDYVLDAGYNFIKIDFKPESTGNKPCILLSNELGYFNYYIPYMVLIEGKFKTDEFIPNINEVEIGSRNNILQNGAPTSNKDFWWVDQASNDIVKLDIGGNGENYNGRYWNSGIWFTGTHGKNEETNESWFIIGQNSLMDYKFDLNKNYSIYFYIYSEKESNGFNIAIADSNSNNMVCSYRDYPLKAGYNFIKFDFKPESRGNKPCVLLSNNLGYFSYYIPYMVLTEGNFVTDNFIPHIN